jgi:hypothetical protein
MMNTIDMNIKQSIRLLITTIFSGNLSGVWNGKKHLKNNNRQGLFQYIVIEALDWFLFLFR